MRIENIGKTVKGVALKSVYALALALKPVEGELFKSGLFDSDGACRDKSLEVYEGCLKEGSDLATECEENTYKIYNDCTTPSNNPDCKSLIKGNINEAVKFLTDVCGAPFAKGDVGKDGVEFSSMHFSITGINSTSGALTIDDTGADQFQCGNDTYYVNYGRAEDLESVEDRINEICGERSLYIPLFAKIILGVASGALLLFFCVMCQQIKKHNCEKHERS